MCQEDTIFPEEHLLLLFVIVSDSESEERGLMCGLTEFDEDRQKVERRRVSAVFGYKSLDLRHDFRPWSWIWAFEQCSDVVGQLARVDAFFVL